MSPFAFLQNDTVAGADPGFFFRTGCTRLLLYFNTNKPHSFFLQNTSCIRKPQVISRWGGGHPLHPPPRSTPDRNSHLSTKATFFLPGTKKYPYSRELKPPQGRRQWERKKRDTTQPLSTYITFFFYISCRRCTTTTWNCLISRFVEDVNTKQWPSFSFSELLYSP